MVSGVVGHRRNDKTNKRREKVERSGKVPSAALPRAKISTGF